MSKKQKKTEPIPEFNIDAVVQEANRLFFHQIGLEIVADGGAFKIVVPDETPFLALSSSVKTELDNASIVMDMKTATRKKRFQKRSIIGAQPIVSQPKA